MICYMQVSLSLYPLVVEIKILWVLKWYKTWNSWNSLRIQLMRKQLITGAINRSIKIIKSCIYSETVKNIFDQIHKMWTYWHLMPPPPSPHSHTQTLFLCAPHPPPPPIDKTWHKLITTIYNIHNLLIRFIHFYACHFQSVRVFAFCVFTAARNLLAVAIVTQRNDALKCRAIALSRSMNVLTT